MGRVACRSSPRAGPDSELVGPGAQREGGAPCPNVSDDVRTLWSWGPPERGALRDTKGSGPGAGPNPSFKQLAFSVSSLK